MHRAESCLDECICMYLKLGYLYKTSIITHRQSGEKSLMQSQLRQEYFKEHFASQRSMLVASLSESTLQAGDDLKKIRWTLLLKVKSSWREIQLGMSHLLAGLKMWHGNECPMRILNGFLVQWLFKIPVFSDNDSWFSRTYRIKSHFVSLMFNEFEFGFCDCPLCVVYNFPSILTLI